MAPGYPIKVNGITIKTSEALYQACRYPNLPDVQCMIIDQYSPMTAKMKSKLYRSQTRSDWDNVRVKIMRWCIETKLICNWEKFGSLLLSTKDMPIVEESARDAFWGAEPIDEYTLKGVNALGRLLMEIRDRYKRFDKTKKYIILYPPNIDNFLLFSKPIEPIVIENNFKNDDNEFIDGYSLLDMLT